MTSDDLQTNLRLPAALKAKLQRAAETNKRSMNAEVVARLDDSFDSPPAAATPVDDRTLDLFAEKVGQVLDERDKRRAKR
ncbi:Arc family DNA-binding protein [Paraburkholderia phosphatilytica]|uniref:Arc family DNA-binding protein n=1 Tax=Paraburkholderia phosphatilytica TaxID=2282883 RepID=UPI000E544D4D|nr:Arc family DNA-binding protein [Paraburkholderia phosphatilytica]